MASSYPGAIDSFTQVQSTDQVSAFPAIYDGQAVAALTAIESTLGVNPQGSSTDVVTRLNAVGAITDWFDTPEAHGAVGDGTTDDTTAVQACLNSGKIASFANKTYRCGPLTIPAGARIAGLGTIKAKTSITNHLLRSASWDSLYGTGTNGGDDDIRISGIKIDVDRTNQAAPLAPSVGPTLTATPSASGGTLAANTYGYLICAKTTFGYGPVGARVQATTTGTTGSIALSWSAVTGATGYVIFGRTAFGETKLVDLGSVTTWTDTGSATPGTYKPVHGNNTAAAGVAILGADPRLQNVDILNAAGIGLITEWYGGPADSALMEGRLESVRVFGSGTHSVLWNGPHDSIWADCTFAMPSMLGDASTQDNVVIQDGPVYAQNCHAWGQGRWAVNVMVVSSLVGFLAEGGRAGQMRLYSTDISVTGGAVFSPQSSTSVGLAIGDADYQTPRCNVIGLLAYGFSSSSGASIDLTHADPSNAVRAIIDQASGTRVATATNRDYAKLEIVNLGAATPFVNPVMAVGDFRLTYLTADVTNATNTFADEMAQTLVPGTYEFEMAGAWQQSASGTSNFTFDGTIETSTFRSTINVALTQWKSPTNTVPAASLGNAAASTATSFGVDLALDGSGLAVVTSTGTLSVGFDNNGGSQTVTLRAGTYLKVTRTA